MEPDFKIEAGNLTTFRPSPPATITAEPTATTSAAVAKEPSPVAMQSLKMGSMEDNETQVRERSLALTDLRQYARVCV